jgi:hypothetical protein
VCLQQLDVLAETPQDSPVIMLACYHCFHNKVTALQLRWRWRAGAAAAAGAGTAPAAAAAWLPLRLVLTASDCPPAPQCWEQWSSQQPTCPNCKQPVPLF